MFLLLTAAHGRSQVLLFTFHSVENKQEKKQKALVVARPHCWAGVQVPVAPCFLPAWLQVPPPYPRATTSPGGKCWVGAQSLLLPRHPGPLGVGWALKDLFRERGARD